MLILHPLRPLPYSISRPLCLNSAASACHTRAGVDQLQPAMTTSIRQCLVVALVMIIIIIIIIATPRQRPVAIAVAGAGPVAAAARATPAACTRMRIATAHETPTAALALIITTRTVVINLITTTIMTTHVHHRHLLGRADWIEQIDTMQMHPLTFTHNHITRRHSL